MNLDDRGGCFWIFGIVSAILGFIVDLVAFIKIVGIDFIVAPAITATPSRAPLISIRLPASAELITFLIWFYTAIALFLFTIMMFASRTRPRYAAANEPWYKLLLPLPFFALIPSLLAVWLWVFGHVPVWLYVFLVPTLWFSGVYSYKLLLLVKKEGLVGYTILFSAIGPAIIWFRSGYDWSLPWILVITIVALLTGSFVGRLVSLLAFGLSDSVR